MYSISRITYNDNKKKRKRLKDYRMGKTVMQQVEMMSTTIKMMTLMQVMMKKPQQMKYRRK